MSITISTPLSSALFAEPARSARRGVAGDAEAGATHGEQVSFSREAVALAKQALYQRQTAGLGLAVQDQEQTAADSADKRQKLLQQFRSHMHRSGMHFPGMSAAGAAESSQPEAVSESRRTEEASGKAAKKASDIERQIKELASQLEQVLTSNMPDVAKEERASGIKKKMDELLGQLQALKAGEEAAQQAQADASGK